MVAVSQPGPGNLGDLTSGRETNKTKILVCDPQISSSVLRDGVHYRTNASGSKPVLLQVAEAAAKRGYPKPASAILKKAIWRSSIESSVAFAAAGKGNRNRAVIPFVQASIRRKPDAPIAGGENGMNTIIRQTLLHR